MVPALSIMRCNTSGSRKSCCVMFCEKMRDYSAGQFAAENTLLRKYFVDDFNVFVVDDNAARVNSLGLMEVIKAAMERHASSEQVLGAGLGALSNICVNGTSAKLSFNICVNATCTWFKRL